MGNTFLDLKNGSAASISELPVHGFEDFRALLKKSVSDGNMRIASFFAMPEDDDFRLTAVLADNESSMLKLASAIVGRSYPSLTTEIAALHWFEREIHEQYGIVPENHPWLKPIRFHNSFDSDTADRPAPGVTDYLQMTGNEAHEVAVGPVHAGVIEPGHFRFQCMGETVYFLEIELGYQHRGIEKMLIGAPDKKTIHLIESAAGDSSCASATAYAQIIEALTDNKPSENALSIRQVAMELERIANHTGDLGALAGDVAFLPTASYCGRIRGEYLNMSATLCGNRFGRNMIIPGGVAVSVDRTRAEKILSHLKNARKDLDNALSLMFNTPSVLDRFENTGSVTLEQCRQIGMVGVAARACGSDMDVRKNFPYCDYDQDFFAKLISGTSGDVFARADVRRREIAVSHEIIIRQLEKISAPVESTSDITASTLPPDMIAVSMVEAWRGEMCHTAITGKNGKFRRYKIVDPSFHNWFGLALALRGEEISNFPICNKSFNLSYCGHDL